MISIPAAPGYTSTSGQPGAAASGDKLQNDMEGIDANFDELDERTQNQSTDGTKTDFQGEVTTGGVSVSSGASIKHNGISVGGYDAASNAAIRTKYIDIGDWDMVASTSVFVNHGLDVNKIRSVTATIRDDASAFNYNETAINITSGAFPHFGVFRSTATQVNLVRVTGGIFDNTDFDETSFNRGWIRIDYVD